METARSISSMQSVGLEGPGQEHKLVVPGGGKEPYCSRMASAVTLTNGDILVTGGKGRGRDVFLLTGQDLRTWVRRQSLLQARRGHSSTVIMLGSEERVLVAGGWDDRRKALASVELYSVGQNNWHTLDPLPSPRGDFTLQVG